MNFYLINTAEMGKCIK